MNCGQVIYKYILILFIDRFSFYYHYVDGLRDNKKKKENNFNIMDTHTRTLVNVNLFLKIVECIWYGINEAKKNAFFWLVLVYTYMNKRVKLYSICMLYLFSND